MLVEDSVSKQIQICTSGQKSKIVMKIPQSFSVVAKGPKQNGDEGKGHSGRHWKPKKIGGMLSMKLE